jgi:hypothetical protein
MFPCSPRWRDPSADPRGSIERDHDEPLLARGERRRRPVRTEDPSGDRGYGDEREVSAQFTRTRRDLVRSRSVLVGEARRAALEREALERKRQRTVRARFVGARHHDRRRDLLRPVPLPHGDRDPRSREPVSRLVLDAAEHDDTGLEDDVGARLCTVGDEHARHDADPGGGIDRDQPN